jgi:hypothetical protein
MVFWTVVIIAREQPIARLEVPAGVAMRDNLV